METAFDQEPRELLTARSYLARVLVIVQRQRCCDGAADHDWESWNALVTDAKPVSSTDSQPIRASDRIICCHIRIRNQSREAHAILKLRAVLMENGQEDECHIVVILWISWVPPDKEQDSADREGGWHDGLQRRHLHSLCPQSSRVSIHLNQRCRISLHFNITFEPSLKPSIPLEAISQWYP